jgi:hypothetical protein
LGLDIEVKQAHALGGQLVNTRRRRATQDTAAVDADFAIAQVVHEDEDDVGLLLCGLS